MSMVRKGKSLVNYVPSPIERLGRTVSVRRQFETVLELKYQGLMEQRREARELTIDEYVIAESDKVRDQFLRYETLLLDKHPSSYLTTYERMTSDSGEWLSGLIAYCDLDVSNSLLESLVRENEQLTPKKGNVRKHLRKGQARDYREKRKPETIEYLDAKGASQLVRFGYNVTVRDAP